MQAPHIKKKSEVFNSRDHESDFTLTKTTCRNQEWKRECTWKYEVRSLAWHPSLSDLLEAKTCTITELVNLDMSAWALQVSMLQDWNHTVQESQHETYKSDLAPRWKEKDFHLPEKKACISNSFWTPAIRLWRFLAGKDSWHLQELHWCLI